MPQGIQLFAENSWLMLDGTHRITRHLGVIQTGVNNGSIIDNGLLTGSPWYVIVDDTQGAEAGLFDYGSECTVAISNNIISWSFEQQGLLNNYKRIIYGVY
jgi:hypothetical protein